MAEKKKTKKTIADFIAEARAGGRLATSPLPQYQPMPMPESGGVPGAPSMPPVQNEMLQQLQMQFPTGAHGGLPPGVEREEPSDALRLFAKQNMTRGPIPPAVKQFLTEQGQGRFDAPFSTPSFEPSLPEPIKDTMQALTPRQFSIPDDPVMRGAIPWGESSAMDEFLARKGEGQSGVVTPTAPAEDMVGKFQVPQVMPNRPSPGMTNEDLMGKKRRAKMIGGVFEGGRKFLQGVQAGSLIRAGIDPRAIDLGTGREQIDEEIGRLDDTLSSEERNFVKTQLGLDLPAGMTRTQIRALQPIIATNRAQNKEGRQIKMAAIRAVNSDLEGREARHAISAFRAIENLLLADNATADNGILAKIPAIFESTTHISNFDAQRWRSRPGIQGMADRIYTLASGRISPEHRKELKEMVASLKPSAEMALSRVTNRVAAQFGGVGLVDPEEIQELLEAGSSVDTGGSTQDDGVMIRRKSDGKTLPVTNAQWAAIQADPTEAAKVDLVR